MQFHAFPFSTFRIKRLWDFPAVERKQSLLYSRAIMVKGVALIYCRLVTLVLNWSNMLQTSSAERPDLSSAKKPLRNWDLGSPAHNLKPLTLFTVTSCHTHTDKWWTHSSYLALVLLQTDARCCLLFSTSLCVTFIIQSWLLLSVLLSAGS